MNRALENFVSYVPGRMLLYVLPPREPLDPGGRIPGSPKPPTPPATGAPKGASSLALITSTGGMQGLSAVILVPFFLSSLNKFVFMFYDTFNFDCEEDCIYNFKMEDVKIGRVADIHKVYLQYRDLGKVTLDISVTATQYNRVTNKEKVVKQVTTVSFGTGDRKIHSRFIDLKVQGERPQLSILRKANNGPLAIIAAMLVGNMSEEQQL